MSQDVMLEQKMVKKNQSISGNWEKNVTAVNFDVFKVFLGEHVKSLR